MSSPMSSTMPEFARCAPVTEVTAIPLGVATGPKRRGPICRRTDRAGWRNGAASTVVERSAAAAALAIGIADVGAGEADVAQEVVLAVEHLPIVAARLGAGRASWTAAVARVANDFSVVRIPRSAAVVSAKKVVMALVLRVCREAHVLPDDRHHA